MNSLRGGPGGAAGGNYGAVAGGGSAAKKYRANEDGSYGTDGQSEQQNQQYYAGGSGSQAYQQLDATQQARIQVSRALFLESLWWALGIGYAGFDHRHDTH